MRAIIGRSELVESLGGDKREAERKAHAVLARFNDTLDQARDALAANRPTLESAVKAHVKSEIVAYDMGRKLPPADLDTAMLFRSVYASRLRLLLAGQIEREEAEALIGYAADDLARKVLLPDVPRDELLKALAKAQIEILALAARWDAGSLELPPTVTEPAPVTLQAVAPMSAPVVATRAVEAGTPLSEVLAAFHKERSAGGSSLAAKTQDEHRTAIRLFEEFAGGPVIVEEITRKMVIAFKQALLEMPTRANLRFPGMTMPQAIKANAKRARLQTH